MTAFQYHEQLYDSEIRLLRLLPGEWLDDLEATLYHADRLQQYSALSYAWGSTRRSNRIVVNGKVHAITFNLDRALRAVRRQTAPIIIWVDSICINQDDADEKSHQVGLMHTIFSSATEVFAYLGDGLDRSRRDYQRRFEKLGKSPPVHFTGSREDGVLAERYLVDLWSSSPPGSLSEHDEILCLYSFLTAFTRGFSNGFINDHFDTPPTYDSVREQRIQLMSERVRLFAVCDWWNRMWIVQEACAAKKLTIAYGRATMPFAGIGDAAQKFLLLPRTTSKELTKVVSYMADKVDAIDVLRLRGSFNDITRFTTNSSLLWLLRKFRNRKSSEPRDKVFALLQLAEDLKKERLFRHNFFGEIDYNVGVGKVFSDAAYQIIKQTGLVWMTTPDLLAKSRKDIPSWVPDWSSDNSVTGFDQRRYRLLGEICLYYNASRAMFVQLKPNQCTSEGEKVTPRQHFEGLLHGGAELCWKPVHRLPALVEYTSDLQASQNQARAALALNGVTCGVVETVSDVILSDLSNIGSVILRIQPSYGIFKGWTIHRHPFLEIVAACLCFALRVSSENGGFLSMLKTEQQRQVACWALEKFANAVMESSNTSSWLQQEYDKKARACNEGTELYAMSTAMVPLEALEFSSPDEDRRPYDDVPGSHKSFRLAALPKDFNPQEMVKPEDAEWIEDTVRTMAAGCRLFITSRGQVGVGPESMRIGDEVCILEGGLMPYVLRKHAGDVHIELAGWNFGKLQVINKMTMVGSCFVEGIMRWGQEDDEWEDGPSDIELLDSKLRRRLHSNDITEKGFLLF